MTDSHDSIMSWRVLVHAPQSGQFNMSLDKTLLDEVSGPQSRPQTYLRFYQWIRPTLSIGFSQRAERVVDLDYCNAQGIDIVRRPTGGKAVLHDRELTYSVASNDPAFFPLTDISATYCRIANALQCGLRFLGIETTIAQDNARPRASRPLSAACFAISNGQELLWQNRKLVGSAQRRSRTAFLQHGSILIEFDAVALSRALRSCDIASLGNTVADLKSCLGSIPPIPNLIQALSKGFETGFAVRLDECELNKELQSKANDLARQEAFGLA